MGPSRVFCTKLIFNFIQSRPVVPLGARGPGPQNFVKGVIWFCLKMFLKTLHMHLKALCLRLHYFSPSPFKNIFQHDASYTPPSLFLHDTPDSFWEVHFVDAILWSDITIEKCLTFGTSCPSHHPYTFCILLLIYWQCWNVQNHFDGYKCLHTN